MKSVDQSRMIDRYGTPSRPDDIPEAVWHSCWWAQAYGLQEAASRQIMAAKAEEREDIWAIASGNAVGRRELERLAMESGDAEGCLLHSLLARENEMIAAAIRKRGETD